MVVITLKAGSQDDNTLDAHDGGFTGMIKRSGIYSSKLLLPIPWSRLLIVRRKPQAQEASRIRFSQFSAHLKVQTLSSCADLIACTVLQQSSPCGQRGILGFEAFPAV